MKQLLAVALCWLACAGWAETIRVATFDAELSRAGPGLLLRDIERVTPGVVAGALLVVVGAGLVAVG